MPSPTRNHVSRKVFWGVEIPDIRRTCCLVGLDVMKGTKHINGSGNENHGLQKNIALSIYSDSPTAPRSHWQWKNASILLLRCKATVLGLRQINFGGLGYRYTWQTMAEQTNWWWRENWTCASRRGKVERTVASLLSCAINKQHF